MATASGSNNLMDIVPSGVVTGENLMTLLGFCKKNQVALPAVNCISSSSVNAVLQAARENHSPVIIQFSNGGAAFYAGKGIDNSQQQASIAGSVAGALHVRQMAKSYGVPVVLHTDHCAKKLLPWLDGVLAADEAYFAEHGEPLFSSHMIDLSEESLESNIDISCRYLARMAKINCMLEIELGITGGEEDGVDNSSVENDALYTRPEEVWEVYRALHSISPMFTIAAAFGNVHGVYSPGNVKLEPDRLRMHQEFIQRQLQCDDPNPVFFVFHGGSGSSTADIQTSLRHGVIKMNIDTDTQWAYWNGVRSYEASKREFLQAQIGNPNGKDKPNKKYYDPRAWIRKGEQALIDRLSVTFSDLNATNSLMMSRI